MSSFVVQLPEHLTNYGPQWLIGELLLVLLVLFGMIALWSWVRPMLLRRERNFWALAAEAVIVVPWLLSPLLFGAALLGGFQPVLVIIQLGLLAAGVLGIWGRRRSTREALRSARAMLRESWVTVLALAAIGLFVLWGWMMPFPEAFNGHHFSLLSLSDELWRTGTYPDVPKPVIGYDLQIVAAPPQLSFFLSLFSVPSAPAIASRPIFLLPGLLALMTLQLLRQSCAELAGRRYVGSVAFLLLCFSYFAASDFTQITRDLLSPLLLAYIGYHTVRWVVSGERSWFPFLLTLALALLVRPQIFLLTAGVIASLAAFRLVRWSELRQSFASSRPARSWLLVGAVLLPALTWVTFVSIRYGNPLFPQESNTTRIGLIHVGDLLDATLSGHSLLLSEFFPAFPSSDVGVMGKNVFSGLSFSIVLSLTIVGFLLYAPRLTRPDRGRLDRRLAAAYVVAFLVVLYFAFPTYAKYTDYGAFLLAPFAAMFVAWLASLPRLRVVALGLVAAVFLSGIAFWAYNTWGHAAPDTTLANVKFLYPGYASPIDRLARTTGRTPQSVEAEMRDYTRALGHLGSGQHILFMDLEPGGLIPTLLSREFIGDEPYLETDYADIVKNANTRRQLRHALMQLGIRYVYRPGRDHPTVDDTLIMHLITNYPGDKYVVPVRDLLRRG